jgi:gas vesicle protein
MQDHYDKFEHNGHGIKGFLLGALLGGAIGAGTMLLLAPQSGQRTRAEIRRAGLELREQTVTGIEDAMTQTRATASKITADVKEKAAELQHRGQAILDEQKDRWSPVVEAGQKAVQGNGA